LTASKPLKLDSRPTDSCNAPAEQAKATPTSGSRRPPREPALAGLFVVRLVFRRNDARARETDRLLDADDVAVLLNVPVRWVRQASRDGRLPCVRLGRYVRFSREDVLAWVEAQKSDGRAAASRKHHPTVRTPGTK
jgi:excisionase family DNA binding protein